MVYQVMIRDFRTKNGTYEQNGEHNRRFRSFKKALEFIEECDCEGEVLPTNDTAVREFHCGIFGCDDYHEHDITLFKITDTKRQVVSREEVIFALTCMNRVKELTA